MNNTETQQQSLSRATGGISLSNYPAIFEGFSEKGIDEGDIKPRENVFTYNAWAALGRQVRRGEKGVQIVSWVPMTKKNLTTGKLEPIGRRPRTTTVFHVSQTDEVK